MPRKNKQAHGKPIVAAASHAESGSRPRRSNGQCPIAAAVKVRRMTQEDERQLEAVLDRFLMQIVHEHFEREQGSC